MTKEEAIKQLKTLLDLFEEASSVKQCGCLVNCNCDVNRPTFTANSDFVGTTLNCIKPYNPSDPNQ